MAPIRRVVFRSALIAGAAATLAACAHKALPPPAPVGLPPPPPSAGPPPPPPGPAPMPPVQSGPVAAIPGSVRDFVISAGDRVYFDYDQYNIRPDAQRILDMQAQWLNRYPQVRVRIEGNCDERGTREYNLALGARRAEAVKAYLVSRGVDPSRITTISYGKERPIDPGTGEEAWAHNRNAHTAIVAGAVGGGVSE